jgi:hypothetical protein
MDTFSEPIKSQEDVYRQLLMRLTGVFAANVHLAPDGSITEIHILGSSLRHPKQIMRDVQSALASAYGVMVDHRVISIAQLRQDPVQSSDEQVVSTPMGEVRLRSHEVSQNVVGTQYTVKVTLTRDDIEYTGRVTCRNSPIQRPRAVANAVLQAVHSFLGMDDVFLLLSVQFSQLSNIKVVIVAVECLNVESSPVLIGAAECGVDESQAVVRATLSALNRRLAWMAANPS